MTFINTEGLAIFGQGSEWLWTMAQFLALAVTGLAIFRQLNAQRSANKVHTLLALGDEYDGDRMVRHRLAVLMHVAEGKTGWPPALFPVGRFFNGVALLHRQGDLSLDELAEPGTWGYVIQVWWARCAPYVLEERTKTGRVLLWEPWESLSQALADAFQRRRLPAIDAGNVRGPDLTAAISDLIEMLRLDEEAKTGIIPTWPPASAVDGVPA